MVSTAASGIKNPALRSNGALSHLELGIDLASRIWTIVRSASANDKESA